MHKNNSNNNIIAANKYSSYCYNVNIAAVIPRHTKIVAGDKVQKLKPDHEMHCEVNSVQSCRASP